MISGLFSLGQTLAPFLITPVSNFFGRNGVINGVRLVKDKTIPVVKFLGRKAVDVCDASFPKIKDATLQSLNETTEAITDVVQGIITKSEPTESKPTQEPSTEEITVEATGKPEIKKITAEAVDRGFVLCQEYNGTIVRVSLETDKGDMDRLWIDLKKGIIEQALEKWPSWTELQNNRNDAELVLAEICWSTGHVKISCGSRKNSKDEMEPDIKEFVFQVKKNEATPDPASVAFEKMWFFIKKHVKTQEGASFAVHQEGMVGLVGGSTPFASPEILKMKPSGASIEKYHENTLTKRADEKWLSRHFYRNIIGGKRVTENPPIPQQKLKYLRDRLKEKTKTQLSNVNQMKLENATEEQIKEHKARIENLQAFSKQLESLDAFAASWALEHPYNEKETISKFSHPEKVQAAKIYIEEQVKELSNYFGYDPSKWTRHIPYFGKQEIPEVYFKNILLLGIFDPDLHESLSKPLGFEKESAYGFERALLNLVQANELFEKLDKTNPNPSELQKALSLEQLSKNFLESSIKNDEDKEFILSGSRSAYEEMKIASFSVNPPPPPKV
jgi:hypothetical protein